MYKPELLAPAGSREALIAAIENGSDAVYFGGEAFSARHDAVLTMDELERAIDYAHICKVKAYVTVNTLIKDQEFGKVTEYLQFICNAGADAVIVQDIGILRLLKEQLSLLPVHASTQMTVHNAEGVQYLEAMGVKRIVLARELSLDEIRKIKSRTNTEIEVFIHGALCFSYSGQCLLSSMTGDKSGNRGYCTQPCRRKYTIDGAKGHLLSPRDLNISEHIGQLIDSGIDAFKIEGRLKHPEYVAGVVRIYRSLIDRYLENPADFQVSYDEQHTLLQLFNRSFTRGYFFENPGSNLMSRQQPHNQGTYLGWVVKYDRDRKLAYIHTEQPLRTGDGIGTQGRGTGTTVRSLYINNQSVENTPACATVKIPMEKTLYSNETVFKTYDFRLMESLKVKDVINRIPVKMSFTAKQGEAVALHITDGENRVTQTGDIPQRATGTRISEDEIIQQLRKLGNTIFKPETIKVNLGSDIFIPISRLNTLRRTAIKKLEKERTKSWKRTCSRPGIHINRQDIQNKVHNPLLSVNTCSIETFEAAVESGADVVYLGEENFTGNWLTEEDYRYAIDYGKEKGTEVYIGTPRIAKKFEEYGGFHDHDKFLVANLGLLHKLIVSGTRSLVIDYPLNVFNSLAAAHFMEHCQRVTLSPELSLSEIRRLATSGAVECIVHGFFPVAVSEHNLLGELFPDNRLHSALLKSAKESAFAVRTDKYGRTYIMNPKELCMLEHITKLIKAGVCCLRIEAKMYDRRTTRELTALYRKAIDNSTDGHCDNGSTSGHYFTGVL